MLQAELNEREGTVCVVGAGYMGVEWATELKFHFPKMDVLLLDFLPRYSMSS